MLKSSLLLLLLPPGPQEDEDVVVLVVRLHHPDALLSQAAHHGEDRELRLLTRSNLLSDANDTADERDGCASAANTCSAVDKQSLSLLALLVLVGSDVSSCLLNKTSKGLARRALRQLPVLPACEVIVLNNFRLLCPTVLHGEGAMHHV